MTEKDLELITQHHPCAEALAWYKTQKNAKEAWLNCERGDWMLWILRCMQKLDKVSSVRVAIACAQRILHIYQARKPNDIRPAAAIAAAQAWLDNPFEETRHAADAAADAADAARAAARAAYADDAAEHKAQADIIREIFPTFPQ